MSYGSVYIESDIEKLKKAGYSKRYIIRVIAHRIRYRYSDISMKGSKRIALDSYNGKDSSPGWQSKSRVKSEVKISDSEKRIWKKYDLTSL